MLGANPFASNGSLATAPDWPGRIEALVARGGTLVVVDPRRSPHRRGGRPQWVADPARHRRLPADGDGQRARRRGPRRPRRRRASTSTGLDEVLAAARAVHPRGRGRRHRRRRRRDPPPGPRAGRRARPPCVYGRIGTTTARVRHAHVAGWSTCSTCSPATSTGPAGPCSPRPRPARRNTRGTPRVGRGVQARTAAAAGCAGCPRRSASCRWPCLAEEIDTPGEGQIRALVTVAGNPVLSTPNAGRLDAALAGARLHGVGRHLRQRDHPPRRRDPAGAHRRCRRATTTSRCCSSRCATSPTTARAGAAARRRPARRVGGPGPPGARRSRAWAPTPTRRSSTTWWSAPWCGAAVGDETGPIARPRRRRDPRRCSGARTGPERLLDLMLRTGPYGDGFGADPDGPHARRAARQPARHRPRRRSSPGCPTCCARPTGMIALAPEPLVADVARLRGGLDGRPRPRRSCSSAGATCARTTRGCTTSRCW